MNQLEFQENVLAEMRGALRALETETRRLRDAHEDLENTLDGVGLLGTALTARGAIERVMPEVNRLAQYSAAVQAEVANLMSGLDEMRFWGEA